MANQKQRRVYPFVSGTAMKRVILFALLALFSLSSLAFGHGGTFHPGEGDANYNSSLGGMSAGGGSSSSGGGFSSGGSSYNSGGDYSGGAIPSTPSVPLKQAPTMKVTNEVRSYVYNSLGGASAAADTTGRGAVAGGSKTTSAFKTDDYIGSPRTMGAFIELRRALSVPE